MSLISNKIRFGSQPSYVYGTEAYDSTKLGLGPLIKQYTDTLPANKYIRPPSLALGRPFETTGGAAQCPAAVSWSPNIDWVFFGDGTTAALTRTVKLFVYDRTASTLTFNGFITLPYAGGTTTHRNISVSYDKYTTGNASVSGLVVTGSGTTWNASGMSSGSRIAFGTTDPTTNPTWYEIGTPVTFTITSGNATAGATYSNNGATFTVLQTISAQTVLATVGTGLPLLAGGTLTKVSGTGDATITFSINWGIGFYSYTCSSANATAGAIYTISNAYTFTITAASASVGATYTNNGQTFTVVTANTSGTVLQCTGTGAPTASGTLTYVSGNPSGNITYSAFIQPNYVVASTIVSGTTLITTGTHWPTTTGTLTKVSGTGDATITFTNNIYGSVLDNLMYLTATAGTIGNGAHVIEDLRVLQVCTNTTLGGLYVAKGLRYENFSGVGTTATFATCFDDSPRTNYWIKDFPAILNQACFGGALLPKVDWTTQYMYTADTTATPFLEKYNVRASLVGLSTVGAGSTISCFILRSGSYGTVTGTPSSNNNFILATTSHGGGSGTLCGYFTTATRIYRTIDVNQITFGHTNWAADASVEMPPGGTVTFLATGSINSISYSSLIDRFIVTTGGRAYVTQYKSDGSQWDRIFLTDNKQINQTSSTSDIPVYIPFSVGSPFWVANLNGMAYFAGTGTTITTNFIYTLPFGADWEYTSLSKNVAISPEIFTPNVSSYYRAFINYQELANGSSSSSKNLGIATEPVRLSYRTRGISDDTGTWTLLPQYGDLSGVIPATSIQFKIEWRILGNNCIPSKVYSFGLNYQDQSTDSHYQPSMGYSTTGKVFAWRFSTAFGGSVPRLKVRLYDAVTNLLLLTDDTTTTPANWFKSTDGGSNWVLWTNADKGNEITYLKYTPTSLGDNMKVRALLTQY